MPIADQIGDTASRDKLIELIEGRMEEWFTVGGPSEFSYDKDWRTLIGYPASYGSDQELNDHHFHYSYYVMAAAIVAQYDPQWAADSEWGGMVKELIKDAANPARDDSSIRSCAASTSTPVTAGPPATRPSPPATTRSPPRSRSTSAPA